MSLLVKYYTIILARSLYKLFNEVDPMLEVMRFPVMNLLGMFLYLILFILFFGGLTTILLFVHKKNYHFSTYSNVVGLTVLFGIVLWLFLIVL